MWLSFKIHLFYPYFIKYSVITTWKNSQEAASTFWGNLSDLFISRPRLVACDEKRQFLAPRSHASQRASTFQEAVSTTRPISQAKAQGSFSSPMSRPIDWETSRDIRHTCAFVSPFSESIGPALPLMIFLIPPKDLGKNVQHKGHFISQSQHKQYIHIPVLTSAHSFKKPFKNWCSFFYRDCFLRSGRAKFVAHNFRTLRNRTIFVSLLYLEIVSLQMYCF